MKKISCYVIFCLTLVFFIPLNINAEEIDYKSKTDDQLLQMCFEKNDSFACFMVAAKLKDAGLGKERVAVLEYGASVPGRKNPRSLYCMYYLAESYIEGDGVPQDFVKGYMWANILASLPENHPMQNVAKSWRDKLLKVMTSDQISEAQKKSNAWFNAHKDW